MMLFIVLTGIFSAKSSSAQSGGLKTLYFLADTINVAKENRILRIVPEGQKFASYEFFCKCMPLYKEYVNFYYKKEPEKKDFFDKKPALKYISWQELSDLFAKHANRFDGLYELYIVEVLPNGKFMKNKVTLGLQHIKNIIIDERVIKDKN